MKSQDSLLRIADPNMKRPKLLIGISAAAFGITYLLINFDNSKRPELLVQTKNVISSPKPVATIRLTRASHQNGSSSDESHPQGATDPFKTLKRIEKQFVTNSLFFQGAYNRFDRKTIRKQLLQEVLSKENYQRAAAEILRDPIKFSQQNPRNQAEMRLFAIAILTENSDPNHTTELETVIRTLGKQLETYQNQYGTYPKGIDEDYVDLLARLLELKRPSTPQEIMALAQSVRISSSNYLELRLAWLRAFDEQMPHYTLAEVD